MTSFMMSLDISVYELLEKLAAERGLSVQEFIRGILGEWLVSHGHKAKTKKSY